MSTHSNARGVGAGKYIIYRIICLKKHTLYLIKKIWNSLFCLFTKCFFWIHYIFPPFFLKANIFYNLCRFQTLHDDRVSNSIFVTRKFISNMMIFNLFNNNILCDIIILLIWFLEYWFLLKQGTMLQAKHLYNQIKNVSMSLNN